MSTTTIIVNVTTHETRTYEFEGFLDEQEALGEIESATYDPIKSKVFSEDIEIIDTNHRS